LQWDELKRYEDFEFFWRGCNFGCPEICSHFEGIIFKIEAAAAEDKFYVDFVFDYDRHSLVPDF